MASDPSSLASSLAAAYTRGRVVPFLGAGMSVAEEGLLPTWAAFVERLSREAFGPTPVRRASEASPPDLAHRAAAAVRHFEHAGSGLAEGVRRALGGPCRTPRQLEPLVHEPISWPLVVTTNYDDLYVAARHEVVARHQPLSGRRGGGDHRPEPDEVVPVELLGRSERDCQEVLASLHRPSQPKLWALQGYVGGQAHVPKTLRRDHPTATTYAQAVSSDVRYAGQVASLERELVVGHAEYRRVALKSEHFRRAFAEVYRSRSFLFLGSGLGDPYLLDLFSEVIELYGPSPYPHVAFAPEGELDGDFLRQYFGIWVIGLRSKGELPDRLRAFLNPGSPGEPVPQGRRTLLWSHGDTDSQSDDRPVLEVVRGALNLVDPDPDARECVVVSSGGCRGGRLLLSGAGKEWLGRRGALRPGQRVDCNDFVEVTLETAGPTIRVYQHGVHQEFFAVVARMDPWTEAGRKTRPLDPTDPSATANSRTMRDIRLVDAAVASMLAVARRAGYARVHSMLLAAGPGRTFPQSASLVQMIRGWATSQLSEERPVGLSIYLNPSDDELLVDLVSGRLDPASGLDIDALEFWVDIETPSSPFRRFLMREPWERPVLNLAADLDLASPGWAVDVRPAPGARFANWTLERVAAWETRWGAAMTLERLGVLPGSVLSFSRGP